MARPVGIGALVTVNHWRHRVTAREASRLDDTVVNFCAKLFAKLDTGDVIFGPPPDMGLGIPRAELADMDFQAFSAFAASNLAMRAPQALAAEHGHVYMERWERLAAAVTERGTAASAQALIDLPFETVLDSEVHALLDP